MTFAYSYGHNPSVFGFLRVAASLSTGLALLVAPMLAPEHVHEPDAHHAESTAHRHVESHADETTSFQDHDAPVIWLTSVAIATSATHVAPSLAVLPGLFQLSIQSDRSGAHRQETPKAAHDPPRLSLPSRAPPTSV